MFDRRRLRALALGCLLGACTSTLPARAGAESPLDRIRALVDAKRRLSWENETMTRELAFASTPAPYVFVDIHARTIEFRVRGKAHKTYTADSIEFVGDDDKPLPEAVLHAMAPNPVEVTEKAGGPPELKPLTSASPTDTNGPPPEAPDPNAGPVHSDAGILGVDAPANFDVTLEGNLRIEIRTPKPGSKLGRLGDALDEIGTALRETVRGWLGSTPSATSTPHRAAVKATLSEATAKAFYHSILPGEHVYFLPAPPSPVKLLASLSSPPASPTHN